MRGTVRWARQVLAEHLHLGPKTRPVALFQCVQRLIVMLRCRRRGSTTCRRTAFAIAPVASRCGTGTNLVEAAIIWRLSAEPIATSQASKGPTTASSGPSSAKRFRDRSLEHFAIVLSMST